MDVGVLIYGLRFNVRGHELKGAIASTICRYHPVPVRMRALRATERIPRLTALRRFNAQQVATLATGSGLAATNHGFCSSRRFSVGQSAGSFLRLLEHTPVCEAPVDPEESFVATHSGSFHADEAMACAMLKLIPQYSVMPIVRTRDVGLIQQAAVVVDVGGLYDPEIHRYDHHQRGFAETYSEEYPEIKLSSAGLVFKHFGHEVVEALFSMPDERSRNAVVAKVYDSLVRELDAIDNGVDIADDPRYRVCTHLAARVRRLNPSWRETFTRATENLQFKEAMLLAATELTEIVRGYVEDWLPARVVVEEAMRSRYELDASGEIIKLQRPCPWQEHLCDLEAEQEGIDGTDIPSAVKFVLFDEGRGSWRVQAVSKERGKFALRTPLPAEWRGLNGGDLSSVSEIPGCIFVHASGFIGGHENEAGALDMARKALTVPA